MRHRILLVVLEQDLLLTFAFDLQGDQRVQPVRRMHRLAHRRGIHRDVQRLLEVAAVHDGRDQVLRSESPSESLAGALPRVSTESGAVDGHDGSSCSSSDEPHGIPPPRWAPLAVDAAEPPIPNAPPAVKCPRPLVPARPEEHPARRTRACPLPSAGAPSASRKSGALARWGGPEAARRDQRVPAGPAVCRQGSAREFGGPPYPASSAPMRASGTDAHANG